MHGKKISSRSLVELIKMPSSPRPWSIPQWQNGCGNTERNNSLVIMARPTIRAGAGPFVGAISVKFMLPNGNAGFDLIDQVTIGIESRFAMGGSGEGDDSRFTNLQGAHPVNGESLGDRKFFEDFREDFLTLLIGKNGMMLIVKTRDITTFVAVTNEALKGNDGSGSGVREATPKFNESERGVLDGEHGSRLLGDWVSKLLRAKSFERRAGV